MTNTRILRHFLAFLTAKAISELIPEAEILGINDRANGFYVDFYAKTALPLSVIEEKVRALIKEGPIFKMRPMVTASAIPFLSSRGLHNVAEELLEEKETVIGSIDDDFFFPVAKGLPLIDKEIFFKEIQEEFSLCQLEQNNEVFSLFASSAVGAKDLKNLVKKEKATTFFDWRQIGEKADFFTFSKNRETLFLPKATLLFNLLVGFWREIDFGPEVICDNPENLEHINAILKKNDAYCYILNTQDLFFEKVHKEEALQKVLFLIRKIIKSLNVLDIPYCISLGAHAPAFFEKALLSSGVEFARDGAFEGIEFLLRGKRGIAVSGPKLSLYKETKKIFPNGKELLLKGTFFESIDQTIALLLEVHGLALPFRFLPEELRLLTFGEIPLAEKVKNRLLSCGVRLSTRNCTEGSLKEEVYKAFSEGVGLVVALGEKENEENLSLRERGGEEYKLSISSLCEKIKTMREFIGTSEIDC